MMALSRWIGPFYIFDRVLCGVGGAVHKPSSVARQGGLMLALPGLSRTFLCLRSCAGAADAAGVDADAATAAAADEASSVARQEGIILDLSR